MLQIRLFLVILISFFYHNNYVLATVQNNVKFFIYNQELSKTIFSIAEALSFEADFQSSVYFVKDKSNANKALVKFSKDIGYIIITDDYNLLIKLREEGMINFAYTHILFYDKLVYSVFKNDLSILPNTVFYNLSKHESDLFDLSGNKIKSSLLNLEGACKQIELERDLNKYTKVILRQSIAKKCNFKIESQFDDRRLIYYVAIVMEGNFTRAKKVFDFLVNSDTVKEIIQQNGYAI